MKNLSDFIGRGEKLVERIIPRLYLQTEVHRQVSISKLVNEEDFIEYSEEFAKHKCDLVMIVRTSSGKEEKLVIEVNYKHKEKAAEKWRRTFAPDIVRAGNIPVTIDDHACRSSLDKTKGLFYQNSNGNHVRITWNDFRDVIDALDNAGAPI